MSDAKLGKDAWTGFVKKHKLELDDTALVKVLEKLDKANDRDTADALGAVADQLKKQVPLLVKQKKELGDKLFGTVKDKLYEMLDEAETRLRDAHTAAATEDAEQDSPALLTTAMLPLVRTLLKGEVQMHALIAVGSKKVAVLILRKPISPARRKLLAEYLGQSSGLKYLAAEVAGGSGTLQFLLDSSPGGLSKKLRQAVFEQTGLRCKIFLQFGEETEADEADEEEQEPQDPSHDDEAGTTSTDTAPHDEAAAAAWQQRLDALEPAYQAALRASPETAGKLRAVRAFADGKAELHQYAAALKGLDALEALFAGAHAASSGARPSNAHLALTRVRLDWESTRKTVRSELQALEAVILDDSEEEPDYADISSGTSVLFEMLDTLDESLIAKLDAALNADDPGQRRALHAQALEIVAGYRDFVRRDELLADIDDNGFLPMDLRDTLDGTLAVMAAQLDATLALN